MPEPVIRQRAAIVKDSRDDDVKDWSTPATLSLTAFAAEPVSSAEDNDGRQAVITGYRVYFKGSRPDVLAGDRMVLRGITWEVDGRPADWRSPHGSSVGGLVVALKSVVG